MKPIRRLALLGFALAIAGTSVVMAQPFQDTATSADSTSTAPSRHAPDPQRQVARLSRKLQLTPDQAARIEPILRNRQQQMQQLHADTTLAPRDRRAKIIHAEAEFQASQTLVNAAKILSSIPAAMQLRYLQTLTEIGAEQNSTVVFPMPIDIIKPFLELIEKPGKASVTNGATLVPLGSDVPGRVMENHTQHNLAALDSILR